MKICGIITVFGASVVNPMPSGNITDSESVSQYAQNASLSGIKTQRRYQDFRRMFLDFYSREDLTRVSYCPLQIVKKWPISIKIDRFRSKLTDFDQTEPISIKIGQNWNRQNCPKALFLVKIDWNWLTILSRFMATDATVWTWVTDHWPETYLVLSQ